VADLPGAAHLLLVDEVAYLDPTSAVFEAMLAGWEQQARAVPAVGHDRTASGVDPAVC
jgi:hypothetical protein